MKVEIHNRCAETESYRAGRVKSLFNCESGAEFRAEFSLTLDQCPGWKIGLICGPSGSGKTSLGKQLGKLYAPRWKGEIPIIDAIAPRAI